MWLFYYFNFKRSYDVLKSKSPCILLNKNINFNKNETESKMENPTHRFRETSLVLQEAVAQTCSVKKVFLIISQNLQENTCARVSFLIKLQAAPNFYEHLFLQNTSGGCFCASAHMRISN